MTETQTSKRPITPSVKAAGEAFEAYVESVGEDERDRGEAMHPVQTLIRERVEAAHKDWLPGASVVHTRAGDRYRTFEVALLFAPILAAVDLCAGMAENGEEVLCTSQGKHIRASRLVEMLVEALGGFKDRALVATIESRLFVEELKTLLPAYDGPIERGAVSHCDREAVRPDGFELARRAATT